MNQDKVWFAYKNGFVNCTAESIYLTSSGNWTEIEHLTEKKSSDGRTWKAKFTSIIIFLFCFIIPLISFLNQLSTFQISSITFLFIAGGGGLYKYLIKETGETFRIPLEKIKEIEFEGEDVEISFLALDNLIAHHYLEKVEKKGLIYLIELLERISC